MTGQQRPAGRYGSRARRRPRRWLRWSAFLVALAVATTAAVMGYSNLGSPPIQGKAVTFRVLDDSSVRITVEVSRDHPRRAAVCVVRARGLSGSEVGRKEILVPPQDGMSYRQTVLTTSERPVTGEVYGCSYTVPEYLSTTTRPSG